jgi:hypothetical protein
MSANTFNTEILDKSSQAISEVEAIPSSMAKAVENLRVLAETTNSPQLTASINGFIEKAEKFSVKTVGSFAEVGRTWEKQYKTLTDVL